MKDDMTFYGSVNLARLAVRGRPSPALHLTHPGGAVCSLVPLLATTGAKGGLFDQFLTCLELDYTPGLIGF